MPGSLKWPRIFRAACRQPSIRRRLRRQPATRRSASRRAGYQSGAGRSPPKASARKPVLLPATSLSDLGRAEPARGCTIKTLFVLGGNPAFNAPVDLGLDDSDHPRLKRFPVSACMSMRPPAVSTTHIPAAHFLEGHGAIPARCDGTYLSQQPLILPLYNGISELELLAALAGLPKAQGAEGIFRETFAVVLPALPQGAGAAF